MKLGALIFAGLAVAAPVAAGLFRVWVHQDAVQLGYRLSEREENRKNLRNTLRQLEIELAAERSPAALVAMAQRLKMVPPAPEQMAVAHVGHGGSRGSP
jgi:hypothetical protein